MMQAKPVILVVDDQPDNIDVISSVLSHQYRVRVALNGHNAIRIALDPKTRPDLILLDIMMPFMDGYEVCRQLKSISCTKDIPVIFVTASNSVVDEVKALEEGGVDFISKPINPKIVMARVNIHLKLRNHELLLKDLVADKTEEIFEAKEQMIETLIRAASFKDDGTSQHVFRMSRYAEVVGRHLTNDPEWAGLLRQSSAMHDIGKIGIPDNVLLKPGKLTPDEWHLMQQHVRFGGEIIGEDSSPVMKMSKEVALYHHEKWDGTGYLKGISGESIPLAARIVAVVDVFDALTTARPYKAAWSVEDAISLINEQSDKHFDPRVVIAFNRVTDELLLIKGQFEQQDDAKQWNNYAES